MKTSRRFVASSSSQPALLHPVTRPSAPQFPPPFVRCPHTAAARHSRQLHDCGLLFLYHPCCEASCILVGMISCDSDSYQIMVSSNIILIPCQVHVLAVQSALDFHYFFHDFFFHRKAALVLLCVAFLPVDIHVSNHNHLLFVS